MSNHEQEQPVFLSMKEREESKELQKLATPGSWSLDWAPQLDADIHEGLWVLDDGDMEELAIMSSSGHQGMYDGAWIQDAVNKYSRSLVTIEALEARVRALEAALEERGGHYPLS